MKGKGLGSLDGVPSEGWCVVVFFFLKVMYFVAGGGGLVSCGVYEAVVFFLHLCKICVPLRFRKSAPNFIICFVLFWLALFALLTCGD